MPTRAVVALVALGLAGFIALLAIFGSFYTVNEYERAVLITAGRVTNPDVLAGFHLKLPFVQSVRRFAIGEQVTRWGGEDHPDHPALLTYSRDQQVTDLTVSVNWRLDPGAIGTIYAQFGTLDAVVARIIERRVPDAVKTVFGQYNAVTAVQERARLVQEINTAVLTSLLESGVVIPINVQVENIDFSPEYEAAVNARMLAEVEVERIRQNAAGEEQTARITVIQAQARADADLAQRTAAAEAVRREGEANAAAILANGTATAESVRLRGLAEAVGLQARADALRDNPGLVALTQAEAWARWDGRLPTWVQPDTALPLLTYPTVAAP